MKLANRFRLLGIVFAVLIVISVSITASADDGQWLTVPGIEGGRICFDSSTGSITDSDDTITKAIIPSQINGVNVVKIAHGAFYFCDEMTELSIPDTVTYIDGWAFYVCGISTVTIGSNVTYLDENAFYRCDDLQSINISAQNPNYSSDDRGVFFNKDKTILYQYPAGNKSTEYTIPDSVTEVWWNSFYAAKSLSTITIGSGVTKIYEGAFGECTGIEYFIVNAANTCYASDSYGTLFNKSMTELIQYPPKNSAASYTIPDSVTVVDQEAFLFCTNLTSVTIGSRVTTIGRRAFEGCTGLTTMNIPGNVTELMGSTFFNCSNLVSVSLNEGLKRIEGGDFYCCSKLKTINLPDSLTYMGNESFRMCDSLTSITIPANVTYIGTDPFSECRSLTKITVSSSNTCYCSDGYGVLYNKSKTMLIQYPVGNKRTSFNVPNGVITICRGAFEGCNYLTDVVISDTVIDIGVYAFSNCYNLENLTLGNSVTNIYNSAFHSGKLKYVIFPESIAYLDSQAFRYCDVDNFCAYFKGNAPKLENDYPVFPEGTTVYYVSGKTGWTASNGKWNGYAISTWLGKEVKCTLDLNYSGGGNYKVLSSFTGRFDPPGFPKRDGYVFCGWYTNKNCTGTMWNFVTSKAITNITLYAKWRRTFSLPYDVLPFLNTYSNFCSKDEEVLKSKIFTYEISQANFDRLIKGRSKATKAILRNERNTPWGGSCFGMSSVAMLMFAGEIDPSNYGANIINKLNITMNTEGDKDVGKVESLVNYYQLLQFIKGPLYYGKATYDEDSNLRNLVSNLKSDGVVVVVLSLFDKDENCVGRHAVVGYGLTTTSNGYNVKIYDCSLSNTGYYNLTITNNNGVYEKSCENWEKDWGYDILIDSIFTRSEYDNIFYYAFRLTDAEDSVYRLTTDFNSFTVTDGENTTTVTDGVVDDTNALGLIWYGNQNEPDFDPSYSTELPVLSSGSYTITPTETAESYKMTLYYDTEDGLDDGFFHSIDIDKPLAVSISFDGSLTTSVPVGESLSTEDNDEANQTITSAFNDSDMGADSITITGTGDSFSMGLGSNGEIEISSQTDTNLTLTITSGLSEETLDEAVELSAEKEITVQRLEGDDETACEILNDGYEVMAISFGYAVVFDTGGGSDIDAVSIPVGESVDKPDDPEYAGYVFAGWYSDEALTEEWNFETVITGDITLYAGWKKDPEEWKTVTFAAEGFDDQTITVVKGTVLTKEEIPTYSEDEDGCKVTWNTQQLDSLLNNAVTENVTITGTVAALDNDRTISLGGLSLDDGLATASVSNKSSVRFNVKVYFAAYNAKGKMLGIRLTTVEVDRNSSADATVDLSDIEGVTRVKAFIFDDCCNPLGNCAENTVSLD